MPPELQGFSYAAAPTMNALSVGRGAHAASATVDASSYGDLSDPMDAPLAEHLSALVIGIIRRQRYLLPLGLALLGSGMLLIGCGLLCRPVEPMRTSGRKSHSRKASCTSSNNAASHGAAADGSSLDDAEGYATATRHRGAKGKSRRWQKLDREDAEADHQGVQIDVEMGPPPSGQTRSRAEGEEADTDGDEQAVPAGESASNAARGVLMDDADIHATPRPAPAAAPAST